MFGSNTNYSQQGSHTLNNEASIFSNQFLQSSNGKYYARLQDDGNFVCYQSSDFQSQNAFWSSIILHNKSKWTCSLFPSITRPSAFSC